ncbi:hypothetical protein [Paenibacillus favisporus]|uniref:alpha/beta hydrolase n=1 Tax=Paenibacillus favisporus TaxID=221028 RepID=UPI003B834021
MAGSWLRQADRHSIIDIELLEVYRHPFVFKCQSGVRSGAVSTDYPKPWDGHGDVRFVLDKFAAVNSGVNAAGLEGMMDMERIGIVGHSFGGATAFDIVLHGRPDQGGNRYGWDGLWFNYEIHAK